jgi:hypothetical protein
MPVILDDHPQRRVLATVTPFTEWRDEPRAARTSRVYSVAPGAHAFVDGGRYVLEEDNGAKRPIRIDAGAADGQITVWVPLP